jgi:DNA-binding NtrC family response regulator
MSQKILIIDDEEDYCMILEKYFRSKNYQVSLGFSVKDCLQLLEKVKPDILFLDNNLPDGRGWSLINSITENYPSLKIYLISAYHKSFDSISPPNGNITVWEKPITFGLLNQVHV